MNDTERKPLPILAVCLRAFRIFRDNLSTFATLALFPIVVALVTAPFFSDSISRFENPDIPLQQVAGDIAVLVLVTLIQCMSMTPMATAWHRLIIVGRSNSESRVRYVFHGQEWIYLLRMLTMLVAWMALAVVFAEIIAVARVVVDLAIHGFVSQTSNSLFEKKAISEIYFFFIVTLAELPVTIYFVMLPAAAVGSGISYKDGWRHMKGNVVRAWVAASIAGLPVTFPAMALNILEFETGPIIVLGFWNVYFTVFNIIWFAWVAVPLGVMSLTYRFLVEGKPVESA